jgi:hypothetical protein
MQLPTAESFANRSEVPGIAQVKTGASCKTVLGKSTGWTKNRKATVTPFPTEALENV